MGITPRVRKLVNCCALCLALGMLSSCARWSSKSKADKGALLLTPQKSLDSVIIETVCVRYPPQLLANMNQIWQNANESILDIETRKLLDKNGIRAGVLSGELPQVIREQIELIASEQSTDALEHAGLAADVDSKMHKLQCRAGRRKDLVVRREVAEALTVLTTLDGKTVSGETFQQPAVIFDLRATPHGDGQATIELTPEIQHGEPRQSYVRTEFGVRPEMRRAQQSWHDLKIKVKLNRGQVLIVASTMPPKAVGQAFFTTKLADQSEEHVVLLLRLAETQLDDLFAPNEVEQAKAMAER